MKTAYFDCTFGISGDMILGALVSCGVPVRKIAEELGKLKINGFELREEKVIHCGINATHIDVITEDQHNHRHLSQIKKIIEKSELSERVKNQAIKIFTKLAESEAEVHGTTPEKIHFHEVGALDAIIDVVGACIGLEYLGVETIVSTPLYLGTGTVKCAHGLMPVPVPAVVELTKGVPVVRTDIEGELTTPTGAAIITSLASSYGFLDDFTSYIAGYGAGARKRENIPNVLRITIGTTFQKYEEDRCILIETNIDDMNPEIFGYIYDRFFEAGAKDVYMVPIFMKKGRPATLLSVLTDELHINTMIDIMFSETTTIGVRISRVMRKKLKREERTINTEYGKIRVKVAYLDGSERVTPEFEDCARIARERGVPLLSVYDAARKKSPE